MEVDNSSYRVAVTVSADRQLYMLHSRAQVEYRERRLIAVMLFGIIVTALLSAAGGWWLARIFLECAQRPGAAQQA